MPRSMSRKNALSQRSSANRRSLTARVRLPMTASSRSSRTGPVTSRTSAVGGSTTTTTTRTRSGTSVASQRAGWYERHVGVDGVEPVDRGRSTSSPLALAPTYGRARARRGRPVRSVRSRPLEAARRTLASQASGSRAGPARATAASTTSATSSGRRSAGRPVAEEDARDDGLSSQAAGDDRHGRERSPPADAPARAGVVRRRRRRPAAGASRRSRRPRPGQ